MSRFGDLLGRIDTAQQRRIWLSFPVAVVKKFGDDRAGSNAALVAYYGFFSIFPLMLALVTLSGIVLRGNVDLRQRIVDSAVSQFPMVGSQIQRNVEAISGSAPVVVLGLLAALWAGLGVISAAQRGMDDVWDVPRRRRPPFFVARLRAGLTLVVLGTFVIAGAAIAAISGAIGNGPASTALGLAASAVLNVVVAALAFRILTIADIGWRTVAPGAVVAGIAWTALQAVGGLFVGRRIQGASDVYGFFAIVIGLLTWIYLLAQVMFVAAEINVVLDRHLWPRSLRQPPPEA